MQNKENKHSSNSVKMRQMVLLKQPRMKKETTCKLETQIFNYTKSTAIFIYSMKEYCRWGCVEYICGEI
ncbi:hypothetical protein T01_11396 [Trichinella spiralis]|uniref:Uncharacterized protein n=1 Tax=Trichinella spiralis TaxID=6334 RepID=A0A0V1B9V4_TRISP|nr:hypothetical protein T01_11396 [Trichinella spiralis]